MQQHDDTNNRPPERCSRPGCTDDVGPLGNGPRPVCDGCLLGFPPSGHALGVSAATVGRCPWCGYRGGQHATPYCRGARDEQVLP